MPSFLQVCWRSNLKLPHRAIFEALFTTVLTLSHESSSMDERSERGCRLRVMICTCCRQQRPIPPQTPCLSASSVCQDLHHVHQGSRRPLANIPLREPDDLLQVQKQKQQHSASRLHAGSRESSRSVALEEEQQCGCRGLQGANATPFSGCGN